MSICQNVPDVSWRVFKKHFLWSKRGNVQKVEGYTIPLWPLQRCILFITDHIILFSLVAQCHLLPGQPVADVLRSHFEHVGSERLKIVYHALGRPDQQRAVVARVQRHLQRVPPFEEETFVSIFFFFPPRQLWIGQYVAFLFTTCTDWCFWADIDLSSVMNKVTKEIQGRGVRDVWFLVPSGKPGSQQLK